MNGKMKFWPIAVFCPNCEIEATEGKEMFFSADGELMFVGTCPKCSAVMRYRCYGTHLMWEANRNDMEDEAKDKRKSKPKPKPNTPVQPPLLLPPPKSRYTEQDWEFLKEGHIGDPDERKTGGTQ